MEPKLIELDDAVETIKECFDALYWNTDKEKYAPGIQLAIDALGNNVSAIDPVAHGYWNERHECSECGYWNRDIFAPSPNYCARCGAKMDAKTE